MKVIPVIHNSMPRLLKRIILGCSPNGRRLFAVFVVFLWPLISVATDSGDYLQAGQRQLLQQGAGELLAEDLRQCQNSLGEITGAVSSDDLLGEIFSSFCIGK